MLPAPPAAAPASQGAVPRVENLAPAGAIRPLTLAPTRTAKSGADAWTADSVQASTAIDTNSPLHGSSFVGYSAQSGGGGGGGGSGNPGDPTVTITGGNVVGGDATATVTAPGGATINQVTWAITGAVERQDYTNAQGRIVNLPNPKPPVTVNGGSSSLQFYWDASPGAHTVSATVTYAAPWSGGGSDSETLTVVAPTVNRLVLDSYPLAWVNDLARDPFGMTMQPGFTLEGQNPPGTTVRGFSLGASVTLPNTANQSGNYGFIQLTSMDLTITNNQTGAHTLNTGGLVLDNNSGFRLPTDQGWLGFVSWYSDPVNPGATVLNTAWTTGSPIDVVRLPVRNANVMGNPDPPIEMKIDVEFEDWLVYRSGNGIWVGIGKVGPLTVSGHQRFDAATKTWVEVAAPTPGGLGVVVRGGPVGPQFVTWTGYLTSFDFSPPYPNPSF